MKTIIRKSIGITILGVMISSYLFAMILIHGLMSLLLALGFMALLGFAIYLTIT